MRCARAGPTNAFGLTSRPFVTHFIEHVADNVVGHTLDELTTTFRCDAPRETEPDVLELA